MSSERTESDLSSFEPLYVVDPPCAPLPFAELALIMFFLRLHIIESERSKC